MLTHRSRSILGGIPDDWDVRPLGSLLKTHFAGSWGEEHGEYPIKVLRSTNFTDFGAIDFSDVAVRYFDQASAQRCFLQAGDLLLERSGGGLDQPVGRICFVEESLEKTTVSNFVQVLRPDPDAVDPRFLGFILYELQRTGIVLRLQQQSTQMRNLNYRDYLTLMLPFPPPDEQGRIAEAVQTTATTIATSKESLVALRALKASLMEELFTRGMPGTHAAITKVKRVEYPSDWDYPRLMNCGTWATGGTPDRERQEYFGGEIPWVKSGEVINNHIASTDEAITEAGLRSISGGLFPKGALLIAMYGAGQTRGRVALLDIPSAVNQAIAVFNGQDGVRNDYVFYWFQWSYQRVRALAAGSNQDNLSAYLLKRIRIPLPKEPEQEAIAEILADADAAIERQSRVTDELEQLKISTLQNLITGRVRTLAIARALCV